MSADDRHEPRPRQLRRRSAGAPQHVGIRGDPAPVMGGLRGLAKVAVATVALAVASALLAAVVALLY